MRSYRCAGLLLSAVSLVGAAGSAAVPKSDGSAAAIQAPAGSVKRDGRKVSFVGSSLFSMKKTRFDGTVESSFMVYMVEPTPDQHSVRQYFAVDERKPVRVSEAAKRIQAQAENRYVVVSGLVSASVDVPSQRLNPSVTDSGSTVKVPLLVDVIIDAVPR
jgi:hypothetical protein